MTPPRPAESEGEFEARLAAALGQGFALGRRLGQGGFGIVYAATDLGLRREVAIKLIRPELAAPIIRDRFRLEAEAAAALRHPGIIPIYGIGESGDLTWFVMPLIRGEPLRARLEREGRLPIGEARRILIETASALGAAHAAGLIHRDIKPDNIMLEGGDRRAILMDFGIAKVFAAGGPAGHAPGSSLTTSGMVIGTPAYMSPEQASGDRQVDHRSDLYSLGVVAHEMLTGELPFRGATAIAVLMEQLSNEPPSVARRRPECPAALARAVDRCLARDPGARWNGAAELVESLSRSSSAIPALPAGAAEHARVPAIIRFRRLSALLAAVIALGVLTDLARGTVLAAPVVTLIALGILAARYGELWSAGYEWRDLFPGGGSAAPRAPSIASGGDSHPVERQARGDRAYILRVAGQRPRAERERMADLPERVDQAVARIGELGQLEVTLDRRLEEIASRGSTGRTHSGTGTEPDRQRRELEERRRTVRQDRERIAAWLARIRAAGESGEDAAFERLAAEGPLDAVSRE
jgi:protein kinase-like protein